MVLALPNAVGMKEGTERVCSTPEGRTPEEGSPARTAPPRPPWLYLGMSGDFGSMSKAERLGVGE